MALIIPTQDEVDRFMSYVDVLPSGCWAWLGARSRGRSRRWYGSFRFRNKTWRAHAFAHDVLGGKVCPPGYHRDHTCVFSLCVCLDHLEAVPPEVNEERRRARSVERGAALLRPAEGGGWVLVRQPPREGSEDRSCE